MVTYRTPNGPSRKPPPPPDGCAVMTGAFIIGVLLLILVALGLSVWGFVELINWITSK